VSGGIVSGGAVRNTPPDPTDYGAVVRPIGSGPGGATPVIEQPSANSNLTSVAAAIVPGTVLAANPVRLGFSVRNASAVATLYLKASAAAPPVSATFHTVALVPGAYYEDPYHYVGDVTGVWSSAVGEALVTEYMV
jgi:hypothetical protein